METMRYLFNQRHVGQLTWFPTVIEGRECAILEPVLKPVPQFFAEFVFITFCFSFYSCPRLHSRSDVRKDSLRSVSVYCRTLAAKAGLPFSVFPTENPVFIFSPGSFLYSIMAANSVLWYSLLIFHLFSFLLSLTALQAVAICCVSGKPYSFLPLFSGEHSCSVPS